MTDRYDRYRRRVDRMIRRWATGAVTLTRSIPGAQDPSTPWVPGTPTLAVYTLSARVDGVAAEYVDGTEILASDRMVIASPRATLAGSVVDIVPQMSDTMSIDGAVAVVKKIQPVPAAGPAARFHIFIGS